MWKQRFVPQSMLDPLQNLAPEKLINRRRHRYAGDDLFTPMDAFTDGDQASIRRLYSFLDELYGRLEPLHRAGEVGGRVVVETCRGYDFDALVDNVRTIGKETYQRFPSQQLAKTVHDIRGGGLTSLLGFLQLAMLLPENNEPIKPTFLLVRDHLKIMRNALTGLDDPRRQMDLLPRSHRVDLIVEKWQNSRFQQGVTVEVECGWEGVISECCVEFGALDRILYNYLNNAARHTADGRVVLTLLPLPRSGETEDVRFIVRNAVSAEDQRRLREISGGGPDLRAIFSPDISTTGSGLGLVIASDFVANAYGLDDRHEAVDARYLGARLEKEHFTGWFHWPISQAV